MIGVFFPTQRSKRAAMVKTRKGAACPLVNNLIASSDNKIIRGKETATSVVTAALILLSSVKLLIIEAKEPTILAIYKTMLSKSHAIPSLLST